MSFNDFVYCPKCKKVFAYDEEYCTNCNDDLYEIDTNDFTLDELTEMFTNSGLDIAEVIDDWAEYCQEHKEREAEYVDLIEHAFIVSGFQIHISNRQKLIGAQ